MTIHSQESPQSKQTATESAQTASTHDSSTCKTTNNESQQRRLLKRVWKSILVGDLGTLKRL